MICSYAVNIASSLIGITSVFSVVQDDVDEAIGDAIRRLSNPATTFSAQSDLLALPADRVAPQVAEALKRPDMFKDASSRAMAYHVLLNTGAARFPAGFEQLLAGLDDTTLGIQLNSAYALVQTPVKRQPDVVRAVKEILRDPNRDSRVKTAVLRPLAKFGSVSEPAFGAVRELLTAEGTSEDLRNQAAYTMLKIGGMARSMEWLRKPEYARDRAVLLALGRYGAETKGMFDSDVKLREEARQLVKDALSDEDVEVRRTALETIWGYYGDEVYKETAGGYRLNSDLEQILQRLADSDPDQSLRNIAQETLSQSAQVIAAKNALRKQENGD